jgi:hypothetical protein
MEKPYIKLKSRIIEKLETTKSLSVIVNDYYEISESVSKVFSKLCDDKKLSDNIVPIFYSIQINFERLIENLLLLNYDICFKILRTIIEQTIIFNSLCNNNKNMADYFINWDLLANIKDYTFNKVKEDYFSCKKDLEIFVKLKYPGDTKKVNKVIKDLIKNNYGWYYKKWDFNSNLNLYKIAEQENLLDLYDLFKKYSLNTHNNKLRTIFKQNKYDIKYGCRVVIGIFTSLNSIIQVLQKFVINDNQKYIPFDDVDILICSKLVDSILKQHLEILEEEQGTNKTVKNI